MKIEVYAICYNEEKLLPYFLRHYESFCDKIVIYDNFSSDSSAEICKKSAKTELRRYNSGGQIRDDIYLEIKDNCWKDSDADWVIVVDIDEFVYHPSIKSVLEGEKHTIIAPMFFNMFSEDFPTTEGQIYEEVNMGVPGFTKWCLFRPDQFHKMNYEPGCHGANPIGNVLVNKGTEIKLLHFKHLSLDYVVERNKLFAERLSDINKANGWGYHYNTPPEKEKEFFDEQMKLATKVL